MSACISHAALQSNYIQDRFMAGDIYIFQPDILDDMRKHLPRHHKEVMHSETEYRIIMKGDHWWCQQPYYSYGRGQVIQPDTKVLDKVNKR